jgi:ATP-dependent Clp protease ATP-binding subunit ClpC
MLTDALGNTVDCKHAIIIMTSNIGARFIYKRGALGFQGDNDTTQEKIEARILAAVRETFNPEFINRLDEIITFEPLNDEDLLQIVDLLVAQMNRTLHHRKLELRLTAPVRRWIVDKTCADRSYGARPLRRALQKYVEDPLAEAVIQGRLGAASVVEVYLVGDSLECRPLTGEELPASEEVLSH